MSITVCGGTHTINLCYSLRVGLLWAGCGGGATMGRGWGWGYYGQGVWVGLLLELL